MSQPTLEELAKQGDSNAMVASRTAEGIASLLNRAFEPKGVTAKAAIKNDSLNIIVEAAETPNKQQSIAIIREVITSLQLGYAACRFYEAKLDSQATEATLAASKEATEDYLKTALAQQIIMDQILVHVISAENPEKSWEGILPELDALNISPASLAVIKTNIKSPPPLDQLLAQLHRDFAMPLLGQCERVVQRDGVTTAEEAKVIEKISKKFEIDLNAMKTQL